MRKKMNVGLLLILAALALYLCYLVFEPFVQPILAAIVLAVSIQPLHARIEKRLRRPTLSTLLTILLVVLVVLTPLVFIAVTIGHELRVISNIVTAQSAESGGLKPLATSWIDNAVAWLGQYVNLGGVDIKARAVEQMQALSGTLVATAGSTLGNIGGLLMKAAIALLTLFFFLREGHEVERAIPHFLPLDESQVERLFTGITETIQASMYGMMAVALAQALLLGIAFAVLGVPGPVLWGVVTIFASLIPVVGTAIIWVPAVVWLWAAGSWIKAVMLIAWGVGAVGMVDNILRPVVMSGRVRMHPLLLFFSLLGGAQAFGLIGLFAGPVVIAVTETLLEFLREETSSA